MTREARKSLAGNMMRRWLAGASLMAALAMGAAEATAQDVPGVTENEIRLGAVWATSGPVRFVTEGIEQAVIAFYNEVNEKGGIHGRMINFTVDDDAYQPARTLAGVKKLIERDGVFAITGQLGAPGAAAIIPYVSQTGTPLLIIGAVPEPQPDNVFGFQASYSDHIYHLTRHILAENPKVKLGYLYQNDDLGEIGRNGLELALEEANAKAQLVADVGFERGSTDYATQVLRLRDAGVETVIVMGTVASTATAIKQAASSGYEPTWATYSTGGSALKNLVGDLVEGAYFTMEAENDTSDSAGMQKARETVRKHLPDAKFDSNTMLGYALAEVAVKALEAAGPDLTQEKFLAAIAGMGEMESDVMPLSFSPEKHTGAHAITVFQWKGGEAVAVSDWLPISK